MITRVLKKFDLAIITAFVVFFTLFSSEPAAAQQAVVVVGSPAPEVVTNTLKNTANLLANTISSKNLEALILKEFTLDTLARNQAQKLQQQLVSDMVKMLGGQLPGQNGEIPFIQDYGQHYQELADKAAARIIFGEGIADQCNEEKTYQTRAVAYNWYVNEVRSGGTGGSQNQCAAEESDNRDALDSILIAYDSCDEDGICAGLKAQNKVAVAAADEMEISQTENVGGFKPVKVCRTVETPGGPQEACKITTPAAVREHAASFAIGELPGLQLLNVDEFNEIVSNFMSNLTNQAISGVTGILGLSGNSDYSSNIFGPSGNLSYADALAQDDIAQYQSNQKNPIKEAIANEAKYKQLQNKILSEIKILEDKLAENEDDFPGCFDLELSDALKQAKANALSNLDISSTTSAILTLLNTQFDNATDPAVKNAIISSFTEYQSQGYFRTQLENQDLELSYINYELAEMVDKFKYDTASEKSDCGGEFDYDGVLTEEEDGPGNNN